MDTVQELNTALVGWVATMSSEHPGEIVVTNEAVGNLKQYMADHRWVHPTIPPAVFRTVADVAPGYGIKVTASYAYNNDKFQAAILSLRLVPA